MDMKGVSRSKRKIDKNKTKTIQNRRRRVEGKRKHMLLMQVITSWTWQKRCGAGVSMSKSVSEGSRSMHRAAGLQGSGCIEAGCGDCATAAVLAPCGSRSRERFQIR